MKLNDFLKDSAFRPGAHTALILRGLPGAGKSTLVKAVQKANPGLAAFVASADAERTGADGVYRWTPDHGAHFAANRKFFEAVQACDDPVGHQDCALKYNLVVIDNTNIELIHIAPYVTAAASYGFRPLIVTIACDPDTSFERNAHGVPKRNIERWHQRLGQIAIPKEWPHVVLDPLASPAPVGQD